jgi:hypothetical protein
MHLPTIRRELSEYRKGGLAAPGWFLLARRAGGQNQFENNLLQRFVNAYQAIQVVRNKRDHSVIPNLTTVAR